MKKNVLAVLSLLFLHGAFAETSQNGLGNVFPTLSLVFGFFLAVLIICFVIIMVSLGNYAYKTLKSKNIEMPMVIAMFGLFDGDIAVISGNAKDDVIDHDYDGIQEFDNDLPPWWTYGFYATIIFSFVYMGMYHVFKSSPLQDEEYQAEIALAAQLYKDADQVYDKLTEDKALLADAEALYKKNCAVCHGQVLEGTSIAPNLVDEYWLHKGGVNDVYKTIKYGVVEKGMKSWKSEFSNEQIYGLSSYILSLQGSNPPNAKEPQGEKMN